MNKPKISLIAAVSKNGVIGRDNKLPWHIPEDLKYFKETTLGAPVIMGRKTFESIGRLLPGRKNILVSRKKDWMVPGATVVNSIEDALSAASETGVTEVFVIGGSEIYSLALPFADRLYLTVVQIETEGEALFPQWPHILNNFKQTKKEPQKSGDWIFDFCIYEAKIKKK